METETISKAGASHLEAVKSRFPDAVLDASWQTDDQLTITVKLDTLPDVVAYLYYERGGWMPMMVGNDERPLNGNFALYYILSMEETDKGFVVVRVEVPEHPGTYPSVTPKVPAAVWSEREVYDMFGLKAEGLIDDRRLVLPDDWPQGLYPLRKDSMDYRKRPLPISDVETYRFLADKKGLETTEVPMGPLHITSDEPGHFRLFVEGEHIVDADYRLFYVHRGMEKCAESRLDYDAVTFFADRVCGICGCAHSVAYAETVENSQGIAIPRRAQYIRSLMLEVERLHSHLLNLGLASHYCGFDTGFNHFFRVREKAMDLAELLVGARKTYGLNVIGGVRRDILAEHRKATHELVRELREEVTGLVAELTQTPNFAARTQGVGVLDPDIARKFSPVGPTVRACGFARDVRFDHHFDAYDDYIAEKDWKPAVQDTCDVSGRTLVRVQEVLDSLDMVEFFVDNAPEGPIITEDWTYTPHKFALGYTEAPRGEDVHWSMVGDNQKCYRWRCKAATYSNWPILRYMFRGNTVQDAPLIVGSMDPCYSCTDRVTFVDVDKMTQKTVSKAALESYCRHRTYSPLESAKEVPLC